MASLPGTPGGARGMMVVMTGGVGWFRLSSPAGGTRLVMAGAFVGAVALLTAAAAFSWPFGAGQGASSTALAFDAPVSSCLDWSQPDAADMHIVDCAEPHLFEITGKVDLSAIYGSSAALPDAQQWQNIAKERCTQPVTDYLGGKLDPQGRYGVGALKPNTEQWDGGDRTLRCGVQGSGASGRPLSSTGSAKDADQSAIYPIGTCLAIVNKSVGDPVPCTSEHSYEIVGHVDLRQKFGQNYPNEQDQNNALLDACTAAAASYDGGKDLGSLSLKLAWDTRTQQSWDAGSSTVDCKVGAPLPDGSGLQSVTGSLKK